MEQGFRPLSGWPGCYTHTQLQILLTVYVDDFKMSGRSKDLPQAWAKVAAAINIEKPTKLNRYLGCGHVEHHGNLKDSQAAPTQNFPGCPKPSAGKPSPIKLLEYDMSSFVEQCVDAYVDLARGRMKPLKKVPTPFVDENQPWDEASQGILADVALRVLMKILYVARMARPDLLRATCVLARRVTKWCRECDRRLHRLVEYMSSSSDLKQVGYVGDRFEDVRLALFVDADFAGDRNDSKSTSGVFIAVVGAHTYFPLIGLSRKQTCVSTSTCESEVVAMSAGLREVLPLMDLWDTVAYAISAGKPSPPVHRPRSSVVPEAGGIWRASIKTSHVEGPPETTNLMVYEDNQSTIAVFEKGHSPKLTHVTRTHRVNIHWIAEVLGNPKVTLTYIQSEFQAADIFTKAFTVPQVWDRLCKLINLHRTVDEIICSRLLVRNFPQLACVATPVNMPTISVYGGRQQRSQRGETFDEDKDLAEKIEKSIEELSKTPAKAWAFHMQEASRSLASVAASSELQENLRDLPCDIVSVARTLAGLMKACGRMAITADLVAKVAAGKRLPERPPFQASGYTSVRLDILSDSFLIFHPADGVTKNFKWEMSVRDIYKYVDKFINKEWEVNIEAIGGASCKELKEAVEKRAKASPKGSPSELRMAIVFWNCNDISTFNVVRGGTKYKAKTLQTVHIEQARLLRHSLEDYYDTGIIIGPGKAETWNIVDGWNEDARRLRGEMKPRFFMYESGNKLHDAVTLAKDHWHLEMAEDNVKAVGRYIVKLAELVYTLHLISCGLNGGQFKEGDVLEDIVEHTIGVDDLIVALEGIFGEAPVEVVHPNEDRVRFLAGVMSEKRGEIHADDAPRRKGMAEATPPTRTTQAHEGYSDPQLNHVRRKEPKEMEGDEWLPQTRVLPWLPTKEWQKNKDISKAMIKELRHRHNRRQKDASLSPEELACLVSEALHIDVSIQDVIFATQVSKKDERKPRFEILQRRATVDGMAFRGHMLNHNMIGVRIRAIQGHSTNVENAVVRDLIKKKDLDVPDVLIHGTMENLIPSIIKNGLLPGGLRKNRDDVHFYPVIFKGDYGEVENPFKEFLSSESFPGWRTGSDVAIIFDVDYLLKANVPLRRTPAGAVLASVEIPKQFMISVRRVRSGEVIWENHEALASADQRTRNFCSQGWKNVQGRVPRAENRASSSGHVPTTDKIATFTRRRAGAKYEEETTDPAATRGREGGRGRAERREKSAPLRSQRDADVEVEEHRRRVIDFRGVREAKLLKRAEINLKSAASATLTIEKTATEKEEEKRQEIDAEFRAREGGAMGVLKEKKAKDAQACIECGEGTTLGFVSCPNCRAPLRPVSKERDETKDQIIEAMNVKIIWSGRGVRSIKGDMRQDYKKRHNRALKSGFASVRDRFARDQTFRDQMEAQGWTLDTIGTIDEVALSQGTEARKRSWSERAQFEGYYEHGPKAAPEKMNPTTAISKARRRFEFESWSGGNQREETLAEQGRGEVGAASSSGSAGPSITPFIPYEQKGLSKAAGKGKKGKPTWKGFARVKGAGLAATTAWATSQWQADAASVVPGSNGSWIHMVALVAVIFCAGAVFGFWLSKQTLSKRIFQRRATVDEKTKGAIEAEDSVSLFYVSEKGEKVHQKNDCFGLRKATTVRKLDRCRICASGEKGD